MLEDPLLWLAGKEVCHEQHLFDFPPRSLFLISEGVRGLKTDLRSHRGFLWECSKCHGGWNFSNKMAKTCPDGRVHAVYFSGQLKKSTGSCLDRPNKLWGLPVGHNKGDKAANNKSSQSVGSSAEFGGTSWPHNKNPPKNNCKALRLYFSYNDLVIP